MRFVFVLFCFFHWRSADIQNRYLPVSSADGIAVRWLMFVSILSYSHRKFLFYMKHIDVITSCLTAWTQTQLFINRKRHISMFWWLDCFQIIRWEVTVVLMRVESTFFFCAESGRGTLRGKRVSYIGNVCRAATVSQWQSSVAAADVRTRVQKTKLFTSGNQCTV